MKTFKWIFLVSFLLALTACVPAEKVPVETAVETPQEALEEPLPTETEADTPQDGAQPLDVTPFDDESASQDEAGESENEAVQGFGGQLVSECTLVSSVPEAPQEYADLFAVQDTDWAVGPDDAAITLIEYGDFQ